MSRIVICDDEPHITRAVEIMLRRAGHEAYGEYDGAAALKTLRRLASESTPADLLITDCQMPRMTGLQLAAAVAEDPALSGVSVIMLTAKGYELSASELRERLGIREIICKPFSPTDLVGRVEEFVSDDDEPVGLPAGRNVAG